MVCTVDASAGRTIENLAPPSQVSEEGTLESGKLEIHPTLTRHTSVSTGLSDPLMGQYAGLANQDQGRYNNIIAEQLQLQSQSQQLQQQQQNQSQQLALPLSPLQLGAVSNHLFSLQAVTGEVTKTSFGL